MMDTEGEQCTFMSREKQVDTPLGPAQVQECSMCGDVGFADRLRQCTLCRFRYQHTYCCISTEGLRTGTWTCDWCRLLKKEKTKHSKEVKAGGVSCSVLSGGPGGLEYLLKAALNEAQNEAGIQSSSGDGGSLCSSSIESLKESDSSPGVLEARSCFSEDRMSQGEESVSKFLGAIPTAGTCDPKRNRKLVRCGEKISQKRRPERSLLEQQCNSVQLKRLSSLKRTGVACDPPRSFVRRYKSLSDISF